MRRGGTSIGAIGRAAARPELLLVGRCHTNERANTGSCPSCRARTPGETIRMPRRPAHIHFSLFGNSWASRLVTQMYFAGDPLLPLDPIFNSALTERARAR